MVGQQCWWWAFAMFGADEFEIMGAWRADDFALGSIVGDLQNRGVLGIRVVSMAEAKGCAGTMSPESWAAALHGATPRVLGVLGSEGPTGDAIEGVPSQAIRSALDRAEGIHGSLVRAARRRSPFANATVATEFVASWLKRADRRLYQVRRPDRPVAVRVA